MAAVVSEQMVDPAPTSAPPIAQSMDNHNSSRRFSADSPESLDPSLASSAPSSSTQLDSQTQSPSRVEEYRQLFRLPPDEVLIQDFNCALQENFLLQGHMYLFVHYICFYSNLFGFETKKIIPFHEITSVRRAKAVAVFPTAIEIMAGGKKYFFTSFLFRDEAFKLISEGWLQHGNGSKEIAEQQERKSDASSQESGSSIVEESGISKQYVDALDVIKSDKNGPMLEESKHVGEVEPEIISTSSVMEVREQANADVLPAVECSSSEKSSVWKPEDNDAPGVPEGYTKVAESKFPIQVEEFFNLFFSDAGVNFQESFHRKCGDKEFKCTPWHRHEKFGHTRDVSFQHPIKLYFGSRFGSCQEVQKCRVYRDCHLIVDTSQEINDVPYGDYFTVEARWDVEKDGNDSRPGCILRVYINVAFSKKTMWKGKIVQSTLEECREAYAIWIELAHEVLKQRNLEKEEGGHSSNMISNDQVQREKLARNQQFVESKAIDVGISQITPEVKDMNQRVHAPPQGNVSDASVGSLFKETFAKFSTSFKHQNTPSLYMVITIAIILLLMQISILVLLSRPQRIHVIPQADCMSSVRGLTENRGEALASLNKQIKYLKEEMYFVETMLEKLHNEHTQLQGKLKDLELFRNQRI
ncbi:protein VASCULAR ASSOCIATED DEATH 1, chloroplastic [Sesamum indicum]|uniref:Protein VASCULAR ASSOCIATED DEATH 1, chloroplastic n=1 Tax=Sesamum indicum TaxID=4182 RepID=A0A6I9TTR1_SESIN|nr:protein VASCULAR ASSOCIATED DEATH 1, chloroplastic [Sesamum indicum]